MTESALHPAHAYLQLGRRHLLLDGMVLEVFDGLTSQARVLLLGAEVALDGPDRKGRHELVVRDAAGHLNFSERVEADDRAAVEAFIASVRAAISSR